LLLSCRRNAGSEYEVSSRRQNEVSDHLYKTSTTFNPMAPQPPPPRENDEIYDTINDDRRDTIDDDYLTTDF